MIVAGTGHRPEKLGGYFLTAHVRLVKLARAYLRGKQPSKVISGMALGWDTALAQAAADEKIHLCVAIPFAGQEQRWPAASQSRYRKLIAEASEVVIVCEGGFSAAKMQRRNEWMVDHADLIVALWDGSSGGTGNCIRYANQSQKQIDNLWPFWAR